MGKIRKRHRAQLKAIQHPVSPWLLTHNGLFAILSFTKGKFPERYSICLRMASGIGKYEKPAKNSQKTRPIYSLIARYANPPAWQ